MSERPALLLAIDTSGGTSVAVVREGAGILSQADGADTMRHAEVIGRMIERALSEAGVGVHELTGVVAGMGPGPFTGLRIGIAAARVFALGAGLELLPVVSHDAIALAEASGGGHGELLVTTDARRREVYWSLYALDRLGSGASGEGDGSDESGTGAGTSDGSDESGAGAGTSDGDGDGDDARSEVGAAPVRLDGPGLAKPDGLPHPHARRSDGALVSAGQLGLVALGLLRSGGEFASDQALYLRSPDVTMSTGAKRVTQ